MEASRRSFLKGAIACAVVPSLLTPRRVHADIVGDAGILLAQLEQQIQTVSHAIQTVVNLVQLVEHAKNVVDNTKAALHQAEHGGLDGFLNGLQGLTQIASGVTYSLQRVDRDAIWWQSFLIDTKPAGEWTYQDTASFNKKLRQRDQQMINDQTRMQEATKRMNTSYAALQAGNDAAQVSLNEKGVVGQMQLINRQQAQYSAIQFGQYMTLEDLARRNAEAETRMAAEREATRQMLEHDARGIGNLRASTPVTQ